jgi:hypothetical protein
MKIKFEKVDKQKRDRLNTIETHSATNYVIQIFLHFNCYLNL